MSLIKIPLIALITYCYHAAFTPPQPQPQKDELIPTTKLDLRSLNVMRGKIAVAVQDIAAFVEIVAIVAVAFPSYSIGRTVLPLVMMKKDTQDIHLDIDAFTIAGGALLLGCTLMRLWAFRALGPFFRFNISIQKDHALITTGPYSWVRHPSYTGVIMGIGGAVLWNASPVSWLRQSGFLDHWFGKLYVAWYCTFILLYTLLVVLGRMSKEDEALRAKFGDTWDDWAKKVPSSIIPWVY